MSISEVNTQSLLSDSVKAEIDHWLTKFPTDKKQSAVMPALTAVQKSNHGYLTEELMNAVAEYLSIPKISVLEVATFYTMYELEPVGRNKISICTNISCDLCGCESIVKHLNKKLGIGFNQTTEDGKITLKEVECLGACGGAPALQVNDDYHENVTPEKIDAIIASLE